MLKFPPVTSRLTEGFRDGFVELCQGILTEVLDLSAKFLEVTAIRSAIQFEFALGW